MKLTMLLMAVFLGLVALISANPMPDPEAEADPTRYGGGYGKGGFGRGGGFGGGRFGGGGFGGGRFGGGFGGGKFGGGYGGGYRKG